MSYFERSFSIENDTANGAFNMDSFLEEIAESSIVPGVHHCNALGGGVTVFFKADLSGAEDTVFNGLVAAHQGIDPEPEPATVQLSYRTPMGIPEVAITKPDGNSKTYISHNFCDPSTWPAMDNSKWEVNSLALGLGALKVYKAEVQFTHDVQMGTNDPVGQLILDITAGGNPIPSEQKVFKSLLDVFDLGNKHYSMNATVDGIPGVTTIQFDYTDAIILDPSIAMGMCFHTLNDLPFGGSHCSVSLVAGLVL